jgi:Ser/Thr protein kinase RdoA (MazF antagonist)
MQSFEKLSRRGQLLRLRSLAQTALRQYSLAPYQMSVLQHEHNTTFRVQTADDQSFVLRIHRPGQHTVEAINSELLWLAALNEETELKIPQPVLAKNGALFTIVATEGVPKPRACVLFRWLPGRFLYHHLKPTHLEHVGVFMAYLHRHASNWQFPPNFLRGRVDVLTSEARHISNLNPGQGTFADMVNYPTQDDVDGCLRLVSELCTPEDLASVTRAIHQTRLVLDELGYSPEMFGLIHADLHQENYLFHRGQVGAIDFDDCGFGHYLYDLSVTLIEISGFQGYATLRNALLTGYRRVRPLPVDQESYLTRFFALRCLQLLVWVLESREHPAFRNRWKRWAKEELDNLRQWVK